MRPWACQQLLVAIFDRLDAKDFAGFAALFEADGVWERPGATMTGRAEIAAALARRSPTLATRHLMSNFLVLGEREHELDAAASLTTYSSDTGLAPARPVVVEGPVGVFRAEATMRCEEGGVSIRRLTLRPEFKIVVASGQAPFKVSRG